MSRGNTGLFARLAFYYFAIFLVAGIHTPYWPVWLAARGLSAADIGLLTAIVMLSRVATGPLIALAADTASSRRMPILLLSAGAMLSFAMYSGAYSFTAILLITLLVSVTFPVILPLLDTLILTQAALRRIDYGQVRLWGSISFISASMVGGWVLSRTGHALILPMLLAGCALTLAAAIFLPAETQHGLSPARRGMDWRAAVRLCRDRRFLVFMAAGACIQAGHAVYYTFGTLNWQRLGIGDGTIGLLWACGVIAEIILFAFSDRVVARIGPAGLIALGGAAGVLRWSLMAFDPGLPLLFLMQCAHAFTYGATHLGAMHFLNRAAPAHLAATAQAVYAGLSAGAAIGAVTYVSGFAYMASGSLAYLGMAGICAAGGVCALWLRRHWKGGELLKS